MAPAFAAAAATPIVLQSETKTKVHTHLLFISYPFSPAEVWTERHCLVEHLSRTRPGDRAPRNTLRTRKTNWRGSESRFRRLLESASASSGCRFKVDWRRAGC